MGATEAAVRPGGISSPQSADRGRLDRNFFLLMVMLIWLGILMGFGPEVAHRIQARRPFEMVVYIHGVVFVGWLCLLTAQVLLIRSRRVDIHRELGMAGVALYGAMIVLAAATSVVVDYDHFATPQSDPSFLSIQLADIVSFAVLGGAAIAWRKSGDAHKRLMILATICISNAGFARWWDPGLEKLFGDGLGGSWMQDYFSDFLLIALLGAYDLFTRRRLYFAYVLGSAWELVVGFIGVWLYVSPWWKPVATTLIGR